jgi:hypothetical protein
MRASCKFYTLSLVGVKTLNRAAVSETINLRSPAGRLDLFQVLTQFLRPIAIGRIEFSVALLLSSSSG